MEYALYVEENYDNYSYLSKLRLLQLLQPGAEILKWQTQLEFLNKISNLVISESRGFSSVAGLRSVTGVQTTVFIKLF